MTTARAKDTRFHSVPALLMTLSLVFLNMACNHCWLRLANTRFIQQTSSEKPKQLHEQPPLH